VGYSQSAIKMQYFFNSGWKKNQTNYANQDNLCIQSNKNTWANLSVPTQVASPTRRMVTRDGFRNAFVRTWQIKKLKSVRGNADGHVKAAFGGLPRKSITSSLFTQLLLPAGRSYGRPAPLLSIGFPLSRQGRRVSGRH
jgi:hypothetical protein